MTTLIEIVDYRPVWIAEYQQIAAVLWRALGESAQRIDHVGSTAVSNLCAKDIIDVQVTVKDLEPSVTDRLRAAGFVQHPEIERDHVPAGYEGPEQDWAKFLFMQPAGERRVNIHVRQVGRPNQRFALLFRDYLRCNPHVAAAYGELKRRLASSLVDDSAYPEVKDPAVDLIYFAAEQWAEQSRWQPAAAVSTKRSSAMSLEGRVASDADAAQLAAMNQQLIHDEGHRNTMSLKELEERITRWLHGEYEVIVLRLDGATAGYAVYKHERDWTYLRQLFVLPEHRRQGIGRAAFQWLVANRWQDAIRIRLDVLVGNDPGIAFWRAVGFRDYCLTMEMDTGVRIDQDRS